MRPFITGSPAERPVSNPVLGYLEYLTDAILNSVNLDTAKGHKLKLLKVITGPFTSLVIKVRKSRLSLLNTFTVQHSCVFQAIMINLSLS